MNVDYILCCDWGTSSFRLRLLDLDGKIIAETSSDQGILATNDLWEKIAGSEEKNRFTFYLTYIRSRMASLQSNDAIDVLQLPLVISGMATSTIGMKNIPYSSLPFHLNGSVGYEVFEQAHQVPVILVTGIASHDDILRGEETQMMGLFHLPTLKLPKDGLFLLPGTHSKHIEVAKECIVNFKTFMTGEIFQLLKEQGTLSKSMEQIKDSKLSNPKNTSAFNKGVEQSKKAVLLNELFKIRSNDILGHTSKEENNYYLSGLLIGNELAYLKDRENANQKLVLCAGASLLPYYTQALTALGLGADCIIVESAIFEKATTLGQLAVYKNYAQIK